MYDIPYILKTIHFLYLYVSRYLNILYEHIYLENKPDEQCNSGWINPIYKFNQPLKLSKGQVIKVKATLLKDRVWYEFI